MESLKHNSKVNNPFAKNSTLGKAWDIVETHYHNSWKIEYGVLLHQRKAKTFICDSDTFETLIQKSKESAELYAAKQKEQAFRYPYENACKFVAFKARDCMGNGQDVFMDLTINNKIKNPIVDVVAETKWDKFGRNSYPVTEYKSKITCGKRHLKGFEAAFKIGVVDKLTTLYYNEVTFEAIWCRRSNKGLVVEHGFMKPLEQTYVHGSTLQEVDDNIAKRNDKQNSVTDKATYTLARSLGFCREGILAWCDNHGVSPRSKLSKEQLMALDPSNHYVLRLASHLQS